MFQFSLFVLRILAFFLLARGAMEAMEPPMDSADTILVAMTLVLTANIMESFGAKFGKNNREGPTLPGPDKL